MVAVRRALPLVLAGLLSACGSFSPYTDESQLKFLEELVLAQQQEILAEEAQLAGGCPPRALPARRR